jgi:VWFA-related protein
MPTTRHPLTTPSPAPASSATPPRNLSVTARRGGAAVLVVIAAGLCAAGAVVRAQSPAPAAGSPAPAAQAPEAAAQASAGAQAPAPAGQVPGAAPGAGQQVPPVEFEVGVELVTVDVSVVDRDGKPVRGLTKDDFELEVDGAPRPIASSLFIEQSARTGPEPNDQFSTNEGAAGGRLIMVVVDQGNIRTGASTAFIRAAGRLLDDVGPGDRVALAVIPGGRVMDFTPHVASVRMALQRAVGSMPPYESGRASYNMSVAEAMAYDRGDVGVINEVAQRECPSTISAGAFVEGGEDPIRRCIQQLEVEAQDRAQFVKAQTNNSLTALRLLLDGLAKVKGPKTMILLSEGLILDRTLSEVAWVSDAAAAARASIYAVVLDDAYADMDTSQRRISPTTTEDRRLRSEGITALVGLARGSAQFVSGGSDVAFARLSKELTGYYLLGFEPDGTERDGKAHRIAVKVRRPGVEVRARRSFTMDPAANARRADDEALAETLRDPLLATDVRLRLATYSFPDPGTGKVRLLMTAGLGLPNDDGPVGAVGFKLTDEEGKLVSSGLDTPGKRTEGDHRWNGSVVVEPGTYVLKVAAVDIDGRRGSVEHRLKAGLTPAGALALGDLMLAERVEAGPDGVKPEIEPRVTGAEVSGYVEVFAQDAAVVGRTAARFEVASDPNGPAIVSEALDLVETKSPSRRIGRAGVSLADLPPGQYVARAVVLVDGKPVGRILRDFTFAPSSETRALGTGGATSLTWVKTGFTRERTLEPELVTRMLAPLDVAGLSAPVAAAAADARRGSLTGLPDVLRDVKDDGAAASLLYGLGLYARGDIEPAASLFRKAIRADGDLAAAAFYLGACYAAGGRDREAVGAWQTTLATDQADPAVFALTSEAYLRLRDFDAAVDVAREAVTTWPESPTSQRQLIRATALAGRGEESLQHVDEYLVTHPSDHEVLLLAMKLLYDASADGRPIVSASSDRTRYDRYLAAYRAAKGPEVALAERWRQAVGS